MAGRSHPKRIKEKARDGHPRTATPFTCPDCQGTIFAVRANDVVRFRCRVGHLYSPENMFEAQSDNVERLMWAAARALEEQAEYTSQMAGQMARSSGSIAREYRTLSRSAQQKADVLRKLILEPPGQTVTAHARSKRRTAARS